MTDETHNQPKPGDVLTPEAWMEYAVAECPDCRETYCHERIADAFSRALARATAAEGERDALRAEAAEARGREKVLREALEALTNAVTADDWLSIPDALDKSDAALALPYSPQGTAGAAAQQSSDLADALEKIAALHPAVLSDGDYCDCDMHAIAAPALRAAGRLGGEGEK